MARMSRRWAQAILVAALSVSSLFVSFGARAQAPSIAVAPVTGDRATAELRARVAQSLAEGLSSSGAAVEPVGAAAYVLRGTLEVEGRSYALRLEMLDAKTGSVLATREDHCEICTEAEALETWNTAASTLKARVLKRSDVASAKPVPPAAEPATSTPAVQLSLTPTPPHRHKTLGWTAIAGGAVGIGLGAFWASYDWQRTCDVPEGTACAEQYHNNKYYGGAVVAVGVAAVTVGILALLGKL
jgi:hypothetical protein